MTRPPTREKPSTAPAGAPRRIVHLSPEQIEKSANRLSHRREKTVNLPQLVPRRVLTAEEEEKSVHRLHDASIQAKQHTISALEGRFVTSRRSPRKKVEQHVLDEAVTRMYQQSMAQKREGLEKLRRQLVAEPAPVTLSGSDIKKMADRLCHSSAKSATDARTRLYEKYVLEKAPKVAKLSRVQISAAASRLSSVKNA